MTLPLRPWGGEGRGEVGRCVPRTRSPPHPPIPAGRGPSLSPLKGGERVECTVPSRKPHLRRRKATNITRSDETRPTHILRPGPVRQIKVQPIKYSEYPG